jgi:polyhydroxyalkanoate synthesis regulator phasin
MVHLGGIMGFKLRNILKKVTEGAGKVIRKAEKFYDIVEPVVEIVHPEADQIIDGVFDSVEKLEEKVPEYFETKINNLLSKNVSLTEIIKKKDALILEQNRRITQLEARLSNKFEPQPQDSPFIFN